MSLARTRVELTSSGDRIVLTHEATSRRTFAEGAVLAAEWIAGRTGFYDFKDIFAQLVKSFFHHGDTEDTEEIKSFFASENAASRIGQRELFIANAP